jgi:hypothetical protein
MFTVFLASRLVANAKGEVVQVKKEKPVLLFKGAKEGKISKEISQASTEFGCTAHTSDNGWMNADLFLDWCKAVPGKVDNALLVMDLFSAHRADQTLDWLRKNGTHVLFVPAGCTSIIQVGVARCSMVCALCLFIGNGCVREPGIQSEREVVVHEVEG